MVRVSLVAVACFHELMPRNRRHRIQQTLITDTPGAELRLDHLCTFDRERFGMGFGKQGLQDTLGSWQGLVWLPYFFRWRTRTSKLTTPFWSRTPTMETLRVMLYSTWMICCDAWETLVV